MGPQVTTSANPGRVTDKFIPRGFSKSDLIDFSSEWFSS